MEEATSSRDSRKKKILDTGGGGSEEEGRLANSITCCPDVSADHSGDKLRNTGLKHGRLDDTTTSKGDEFLSDMNKDDSSSIHQSGGPASYISEAQSPVSTSIIPNSVNDKEICPAHPKSPSTTFSARKISSCIIASEPTRTICSFTIALLVVFSYIDKPLLGWNLVKSESIVSSRPLYILLLTDLSIIFARLHLERQRLLENAEQGQATYTSQQGQSWAGAVKVLENGLVVYQTIRAVFIDFSIYTVVVVLGLSFV